MKQLFTVLLVFLFTLPAHALDLRERTKTGHTTNNPLCTSASGNPAFCSYQVDDNFLELNAGSVYRGATQTLSAADSIDCSAAWIIPVAGSGGAVDLTSNPQVATPTGYGANRAKMCIIEGTSAVSTVTLDDGTGLDLEGQWVGGAGNRLFLVYNGTEWTEFARRVASPLGSTVNASEMADENHGDITWSGGVATINEDAVGATKLDDADTPADEECLTYEASGGRLEWQACGAGSGSNSFETHSTDNGTSPVADSGSDTLNWTSGTGITITGDSTTDTITVASTLGTSIETGEITDGTITEPDLNESSGTPTDNDVLTYNAGATNFTWVAQNTLVVSSAGQLDDGDYGDVSSSGGTITLDDDTVAAAEMADADHGDVSWTGGVATVENVQCTNCISGTEIALGSDAQGDVYYYDGTDVARLGVGTSGQYLQTQGAAANPQWASLTSTVLSVRKGSAGTIAKCAPVYISGYNVGGWYEVEEADANNSALMPAVGLANASITNAANADVMISGLMTGCATDSYAVGTELYVSATVGTLTDTAPTGATSELQKIAVVLRSDVAAGALTIFGSGREYGVPNLTAANIWVGSAGNAAVMVDPAGDVEIANDGTTTIQADSVALTTDTTGNYAAGDAEAGNATGVACAGSCISDAEVDDNITASSYLPLAGGTMTGQLVTDNLGIEFEESDTNPTCAAGNYNIYADLSDTLIMKCVDGVAEAVGGPEADTLQTVSARGSTYTGANSEANSVQIGSGSTNTWKLWFESGVGCRASCDSGGAATDWTAWIETNQNGVIYDEEDDSAIVTYDPDATALGDGTITVRDPLILATGYVDAETCGGSPTTTPVTVSATCVSSGVWYNGSDTAKEFDLPPAASGKTHCFNSFTFAKVLTIDPDVADTITIAGVTASAGEAVVSSGAINESACFHGQSDSNWVVWGAVGTWAQAVP